MFNNIILKINILSFMTGIRQTDVKGISSGNPACPPPVTCGDSPLSRGATPIHPLAGVLSQATGLLLNR